MQTKLVVGLVTAAMAAVAPPVRAQAGTGQVTVLTIIDVISNYAMAQNVENSAALLRKLAADTKDAPGLVSFKILRDATRANHFVVEAVWTDMQSFDKYSAADTTRAFRQAFQPRQGGPFDERVYVDLN